MYHSWSRQRWNNLLQLVHAIVETSFKWLLKTSEYFRFGKEKFFSLLLLAVLEKYKFNTVHVATVKFWMFMLCALAIEKHCSGENKTSSTF